MRTLVGIICIVLFTACSESREEAVYRLVKEWTGKEIKFPERSVFTVQGKDTVDFTYQDADYKVLVYVDSIGCTSCKLQLDRWKKVIKEMAEETGKDIPFLFFFHPKDMKELRYLTRRDAFTYPVCFDENDELNALNCFPSDMTFQTFLLNKDNKVVSIGNPVHNPKVKELYMKHITGSRSDSMDSPKTSVELLETEKDLGYLPLNEKREHVFKLVNTGNKPLVVYDVTTSCGCTKAEYGKELVRPGDTLDLKVIYNAEDKGRFRKNLSVYCNVEDSPLKLTVLGIVE
ncbi:MAG: DUF1573 domain-containing protein [Bacteroidaceae bacterium]|nr:DUF1573 domain-containing protein [Bacteroidaceae bacterium]